MEKYIKEAIAAAFDADELKDAIIEKISEYMDYECLAENLLESYDIIELMAEVAEEEVW